MSYKPFTAQKLMKGLMEEYFRDVDAAARDPQQRVAWCTSVGPAELLISLGYKVYYPENHGALLGATRTANTFIPRANAIGYSPDICSYLTSDIGAYLAGDTPLRQAYGIEGVPRPDVLVYNTNQCRDVQDWFAFYARQFDVPLLGVHSPVKISKVTDDHVRAMEDQYRALLPDLERVAGKSFDIDRFREVLTLSAETTRLWKACLGKARLRPSPLTFFDTCILMGPAVVLRGTPQSVAFYRKLLAELEDRIVKDTFAVDGECLRVYWDGMPIWGKLRDVSDIFQGLRICAVVSTYCNSWVFDSFDPDNPFASMARAYLELFILLSDHAKEAVMERFVEDFSVDGIVYHNAKTCPNNSNTSYGLPQRLKERNGVPYVILYGDLNDLRLFSEEQSRTNIEAFAEQLRSRR